MPCCAHARPAMRRTARSRTRTRRCESITGPELSRMRCFASRGAGRERLRRGAERPRTRPRVSSRHDAAVPASGYQRPAPPPLARGRALVARHCAAPARPTAYFPRCTRPPRRPWPRGGSLVATTATGTSWYPHGLPFTRNCLHFGRGRDHPAPEVARRPVAGGRAGAAGARESSRPAGVRVGHAVANCSGLHSGVKRLDELMAVPASSLACRRRGERRLLER